jgi:hypothetical protein
MSKYFDRFPLAEYNGKPVRNILTKVDLSDQTKADIYSYFEYTLQEGLVRPDILASNYYGNPEFDWLFYLVNQVVDPYYSFYLEEDVFLNYIEKKYGSQSAAESKIVFYRNSWYLLEESTITISAYDGLSTSLQQYYKPVLNNSGYVASFERIKQDWIRSTNKIIELTVSSVEDFDINDVVVQSSTGARATVAFIDTANNILTVKHINGSFAAGGFYDTAITSINLITTAIPETEAAFWEPVTAFDYESEENEKKRNIFVLPKTSLSTFESQFVEKISQ